jgi:hypothetical protein
MPAHAHAGARRRRPPAGRAMALAAFALALAAAAGGSAAATEPDPGRTPMPQYRIENPERHCVAPPGVMRRQHPGMLRHQRELTVHQGMRAMPAALRSCIECHASHDTGSVLGGSGNFCQGCHEFTGVRLDCFECHSSAAKAAELPDEARSAKAVP